MTLYLQVNYPVAAGTSHQVANFNRRGHLAQYLGAVLVPSRLVLAGRPPRSRDYPTTLAGFIDFSAVVCLGRPMPMVERPPEQPPRRRLEVTPATALSQVEAAATPDESGDLWLILNIKGAVPANLLRALPVFKDAQAHNKARQPKSKSFFYPVGNEPRRIAGLVAMHLGGAYTCIHVRRGDQLRNPQYAAHTTLDEIEKGLKFAGLHTVYVMSDEAPEYFLPLRERGFKVCFYTDFPELRVLADPQVYGGHMLYMVERDLMRRAARRVVTQSVYAFEYADCISPYAAYDYALIPPHCPPNPRPT